MLYRYNLRIQTSLALTCIFIGYGHPAGAQVTIQQTDPPQGVVNSAQPWLTFQDWYCTPPNKYNANAFAKAMANRISALGASGWEPVAFNQVSIAGQSCFLATFKAPKQK